MFFRAFTPRYLYPGQAAFAIITFDWVLVVSVCWNLCNFFWSARNLLESFCARAEKTVEQKNEKQKKNKKPNNNKQSTKQPKSIHTHNNKRAAPGTTPHHTAHTALASPLFSIYPVWLKSLGFRLLCLPLEPLAAKHTRIPPTPSTISIDLCNRENRSNGIKKGREKNRGKGERTSPLKKRLNDINSRL